MFKVKSSLTNRRPIKETSPVLIVKKGLMTITHPITTALDLVAGDYLKVDELEDEAGNVHIAISKSDKDSGGAKLGGKEGTSQNLSFSGAYMEQALKKSSDEEYDIYAVALDEPILVEEGTEDEKTYFIATFSKTVAKPIRKKKGDGTEEDEDEDEDLDL